MPKNISWRTLVQKFRRLGYDGPFAGGRHLFMAKGQHKVHIPNPHVGDLPKYFIARILRESGISPEEWDEA